MTTIQFQELIKAITGRPLTIENIIGETPEEIQLDSALGIYRPWKNGVTKFAFTWKTPKREDSLVKSFITAFCSKYKEPDPTTYVGYNRDWSYYVEKWNNPETKWSCGLWGHHVTHMLSKEKLREQVVSNFSKFDSKMGRLGFYHTNYGIGLFTMINVGGAWVSDSLNEMSDYLKSKNIPFRNELSEAGWVTRFVINADKETHGKILGQF